MDEREIHYVCAECEQDVTVEYGEEVINKDGELVCENCLITIDDIDFPLWFAVQIDIEGSRLDERFEDVTGLPIEKVEHGAGASRSMLYVWYKVKENGAFSGPYDEKEGERL